MLLRWVRRRRHVLHLICVGPVDRLADLARRQSLVQHLGHVTRDPEAHASSGSHRVEDDCAVGTDTLDVTVTIASMPVPVPATAETRHVPHQLTVSDLELVELLHFRVSVSDERRPVDLGQIPVRFVGRFETAERRSRIRAHVTRRGRSRFSARGARTSDHGHGGRGDPEPDEMSTSPCRSPTLEVRVIHAVLEFWHR